MTGRQRPADQHVVYHVGQLQKPQGVGDVTAAFTDDLTKVRLAVAVLIHKLLIASRLLDGIEVSALDVFYDRQFQRRAIIDVSNDNRQFCQPGSLSRPPAPLAGNDLVTARLIRGWANNNRLNNAVLLDRLRQLDQVCFIETTSWITRVRGDEFVRNGAIRRQLVRWLGSRTVHITDQGGKTPPKASSRRLFVHQFVPVSRTR